jgi:hypothetical protein
VFPRTISGPAPRRTDIEQFRRCDQWIATIMLLFMSDRPFVSAR